MVPKHPDTLKTPTLPYVHTPLPPKYWPNMYMHVMGGCQAGKARRKCDNGPRNCPGPLLFLKFLIILRQINMRHFWSGFCFCPCRVGQRASRRRQGSLVRFLVRFPGAPGAVQLAAAPFFCQKSGSGGSFCGYSNMSLNVPRPFPKMGTLLDLQNGYIHLKDPKRVHCCTSGKQV